ncbi:MAG: hypothetical protein C5B46_09910 [Proteobacteria bacterium]|nr:MAG: hypothetical protein C5B46_09910 [Pseudomonadota bacterium]
MPTSKDFGMRNALTTTSSLPRAGSGTRDTLPKLLLERLARPQDTALRHKALGIWNEWTWRAVAEEIELLAHALAAAGFSRGDTLSLLGERQPRLIWAALAAQSLGGAAAIIDAEWPSVTVASVINSLAIRFIYAHGEKAISSARQARDGASASVWSILDDESGFTGATPGSMGYEQAQAAGREHKRAFPDYFVASIDHGRPDDAAVVYYHLDADGALHVLTWRQEQLVSRALELAAQLRLHSTDELIAAGPLGWPVDALFGLATWLAAGLRLNLPENRETVFVDRREIGPTLYYDQPAGYRRLRDEVVPRLPRLGSLRRRLIDASLAAAIHSKSRQSPLASIAVGLALAPARWLLLNPLRDVMGLSRAHTVLSAGESLPTDIAAFYRALRVPLHDIVVPKAEVHVFQADAALGIPVQERAASLFRSDVEPLASPDALDPQPYLA